MTSIAQRRVAGATALMILLYLLQVALFAQPAAAANTDYKFVFQNGVEVTGSVTGGDATLDNSIFVDFYAPDPVPFDLPVSLHVSCSESYPNGWDPDGGDFPYEPDHVDWQISWYEIEKVAGQERSCGETFELSSITVVKNTDPEIASNFTFDLSGTIPPAPGTSGTDPIEYGPETKTAAGNGGSATWPDLAAGAYSLEEDTTANPTGYAFASVECVDNETEAVIVASPGANPAEFDLEGGQHVTCTFHNTSSTTPVASVSVGAECRDGVAYFLVTDLTNATLNVDLNGDGDFADTGETNVTTASEITATAGTSIKWEATATGDAEFDGGLTVKTGSVTTPDCTTLTPSVSITHSSTCGQFSVTVTTDDIGTWQYGVTVWVDGVEVDSNLVVGDGTDTITVNLPEDSSEGSATIVYYVSDATEWDLVPEDLDWQAAYTTEPTLETEGFKYRTVNVDTDCETPVITTTPQSENVTVEVDGVCEVDGLGNGVGEFTVTITPATGATVTINGTAVADGGSIVLPDDADYPVTVVAAAGFTLVGGTPTASVGDCPEEPVEVLGTTITTVPEVSADTLPFTGSESGDIVKLAMLALAAGALMLFAVRGPKEEEEAATEIGGWSSL